MKFQTIFTIIIFLYVSVYAASIENSEINNLAEGSRWDQAMKACEDKGGNLPGVQTIMTGSGFSALGLVNRELENITDCFWLRANYELVDNLSDNEEDNFPGRCCEVLFKNRDGTFTNNCLSCNIPYNYLCASGNDTVLRLLHYNAPWLTAAQFCSTHAHGLPSDSNAEFLTHMPVLQYIWVNDVRRLNLNPNRGDGTFACCLCDGRVRVLCPRNQRTYCVFETTYDRPSQVTESFYFPLNVSIPSMVQTVTHDDKTTFSTVVKSATDNRALIGGVIGASIVLIIIIIIVVVFLFRRSKKTENESSNSKGPGNTDRFLKLKVQMNAAYTDADREYSDSNKYASIQIQNFEKESTAYCSVPNKGEGSSEITRYKYNEERMGTNVYSVVLNEPEKVEKLNTMKQNTAEEYDKVNIGKSNQVENNSNVYDKTNFLCQLQDEHFENVYNKANFNLEPKDTVAVNVYDKANFQGEPQDELSGNEYAKSNVHREPRDEHTGNEYDNV